jgi:hypothetical protein
MMATELQTCRHELKYLIDESKARMFRDLIRGYTTLDENMPGDNCWGYSVRSLYLDNTSLELCRQSMQGHKNRFKLRVRFYDDVPEHPVCFEIKQRLGDVIRKQRALVHRDSVPDLLAGGQPHLRDLAVRRADHETALHMFCRLRDQVGAAPKAYVIYAREAHVSPGSNDLRITFDRQLLGCPYLHEAPLKLPISANPIRSAGVVLELKFTSTFPVWLRKLVQILELRRTSFPKYVRCIEAIQPSSTTRYPLWSSAS